jgi:hypothetical protein
LALSTALEQVHTEFALELVNRSRHSRLRTEQRRPGAVGAALLGDREERAQVPELRLDFVHDAGECTLAPPNKDAR